MSEHRYAARVRSVEMSGIRKLFDAGGPDAINLGIGQPDFDTPDHIKEAAIAAIRAGKTGYTANAGIPELREAICAKFERENDLTFRPEQILVTAGGSEALHLVMEALVDPGDRVLITDPGFVSYAALATFAGGRPEGVPLDETLHIDVEQAKEQMDGARLFVLNSPANPTGAVESEESIRALVEYANDRGVTVVSDEVYEHFVTKRRMSAQPTLATTITVNAANRIPRPAGGSGISLRSRTISGVPAVPMRPGMRDIDIAVCCACGIHRRPGGRLSRCRRIRARRISLRALSLGFEFPAEGRSTPLYPWEETLYRRPSKMVSSSCRAKRSAQRHLIMHASATRRPGRTSPGRLRGLRHWWSDAEW